MNRGHRAKLTLKKRKHWPIREPKPPHQNQKGAITANTVRL